MNYGKKGVRSKQRALNSKSAKWGRKAALTSLKVFLIVFAAIGVIGAATGIGMFKGIIATAPDIHVNSLVPTGQATIVYDNAGNEIDRFIGSNANRTIVGPEDVPDHLGKAFVAIEDERFYTHNGIDIKAILRSGYQFLKTGQTQGGSTITQQLLKNQIFTDWMSEGDNFIMKVKRKIQEQFLAIEVTKKTDKDMVLLAYMNTINCGQNTLGVESASLRYFGKSCSELTLSESAVIASITQNPSGYNPISFPENNKRRRESCLNNMLRLGFVTQAEYDEAMADTEAVYQRIQYHDIEYRDSTSQTGTYFTDALQNQIQDDLVEIAGYTESLASTLLTTGGLKIYSTQDSEIQRIVDEEFANPENFPENTLWQLEYALTLTHADDTQTHYSKENLQTYFRETENSNFDLLFSSQEEGEEYVRRFEEAMMQEGDEVIHRINFTAQPQASITIIDQDTGYVVALLGGRGVKEGRLTLNRATATTRQPGSTFKIVSTYAPALDSAGMTLATVFNDMPFNYDNGKPVQNVEKTFDNDTVSIRNAIIRSKNVIAVKALTQITPQLGYDYLLNFGFSTVTDHYVTSDGKIHSDVNQPTALGGITLGVTNLDLCAAYASIANSGAYIKPKLYTKVLDSDGNVILDNTSPQSRQVIKETTAYLLTDAMVDVVTASGGTGTAANFGNMAIAAKTGTTSQNRDVWFAGYTPYYTCATWAGYDNNQELNVKNSGETRLARNLWRAVMSRIHADLPNTGFERPSGIVTASICSKSGKLPIAGICDATTRTEIFADGTVPTESCDMHYMGRVCNYSGLTATPECPFAYEGICTLPHVEDASLLSGNTIINPDGTVTQPHMSTQCPHDASFFANPDYEAVINQQQQEINNRSLPPAPPQ